MGDEQQSDFEAEKHELNKKVYFWTKSVAIAAIFSCLIYFVTWITGVYSYFETKRYNSIIQLEAIDINDFSVKISFFTRIKEYKNNCTNVFKKDRSNYEKHNQKTKKNIKRKYSDNMSELEKILWSMEQTRSSIEVLFKYMDDVRCLEYLLKENDNTIEITNTGNMPYRNIEVNFFIDKSVLEIVKSMFSEEGQKMTFSHETMSTNFSGIVLEERITTVQDGAVMTDFYDRPLNKTILRNGDKLDVDIPKDVSLAINAVHYYCNFMHRCNPAPDIIFKIIFSGFNALNEKVTFVFDAHLLRFSKVDSLESFINREPIQAFFLLSKNRTTTN